MITASAAGVSSAPATPAVRALDARHRGGGDGAGDRRQPEAADAGQEDPPRSEDVPHRAADEHERAERQRVGADDPLRGGQAAPEITLDGRRSEARPVAGNLREGADLQHSGRCGRRARSVSA